MQCMTAYRIGDSNFATECANASCRAFCVRDVWGFTLRADGDLASDDDALISAWRGAVGIGVVRPEGSMYPMVEVDIGKLGVIDGIACTKTRRLEKSVVLSTPEHVVIADFRSNCLFRAPHVLHEEA
jgi:hypothetical protein